MGEKLKTAVLGISHFSKGTLARDPIERVTGSIAFGALSRMLLATAKMTDPNGQEKRVLVRAKSNHVLMVADIITTLNKESLQAIRMYWDHTSYGMKR